MRCHFSLLSLSLLAVLVSSCGKKEPVSPVPRYVSILTTGQWRLFAYWRYVRVDSIRVDTVNELAAMPACIADNIFSFLSNTRPSGGDMLIDEGPSKCDPSMPQQPTPWFWNIPYESGTSFIINDGAIANNYRLEHLSDSVLGLRQGESYDPFRGGFESCVIVYRKLPW
jgi:hypothetical protein